MASAPSAINAQSQGGQAGSLFGVPGVTLPTEQAENNDGIAITAKAGAQVSVTGLMPFKNTDIVKAWRMELTQNVTYAAGTTTLTLSQYFPYNFVGGVKLQYQGQYSPIDVVSGVDLAIFQFIRPYFDGEQQNARNLLDTSYATFPYNAQTDLVSKSNYTTSSTTFNVTYDLPGGLDFDRFWPLDVYGRPQGPALSTFVSPQYMAGTARYVQPQITLNSLLSSGSSTFDIQPVIGTGTQTTPASASGISGTLGFQRVGWYQPRGQADSPLIYNWQYTRVSKQYSIAGRSVVDLLMPLNGQILSVFVRMFDPSANSSFGAPISVSAGTILTKAQLLYGSGFYRFQDTPLRAQERFARQHQATPPEGCLIWDMAQDNMGKITNEGVLNTMNTAGITIHLEFSSALSATAYAVVGAEALTYVEPVAA